MTNCTKRDICWNALFLLHHVSTKVVSVGKMILRKNKSYPKPPPFAKIATCSYLLGGKTYLKAASSCLFRGTLYQKGPVFSLFGIWGYLKGPMFHLSGRWGYLKGRIYAPDGDNKKPRRAASGVQAIKLLFLFSLAWLENGYSNHPG